jgi:hypothetical protein
MRKAEGAQLARGFIGEAYSSSRGVYELQVFVRPAIRTPDLN